MRVPQWFGTALEKIGKDVLAGHSDREEAEASLHEQITDSDENFADEIIRDWIRKQLRNWIKHQLRTHYRQEGDSLVLKEEGNLLFDYLPPYLEGGIGRMVHQNVMTGKDWDNALAFYQNRMEQAEISYKAIKRAYDEVRPLLTDESLTTADVAEQIIEGRGKHDDAADG